MALAGSVRFVTEAERHYDNSADDGTEWDLEVHSPSQGELGDQAFHVEHGVTAGTRGLELRVDPAAARRSAGRHLAPFAARSRSILSSTASHGIHTSGCAGKISSTRPSRSSRYVVTRS